MDFGKTLEEIANYFDERGFRYGVIGAFGLFAYGLTRATADLDFVVEATAQPVLLPYLEALGYETLHVSAGFSNHVHALSSLGRVDFVYVDEKTANILFHEAKQVPLFHGKVVPVPRPEHLAAMKILAMKNDPLRTFQEMADIQFLLSLPGIQEDEIRTHFEQQGLAERYHEIKRAISAAQS